MDRDKLAEAWKKYGATCNVFVPEEQPTPKGEGWDRPMPEPSETGTFDPQLMKHWRFFTATRNFLRQRYAEHGIMQSPALTDRFICLYHRFDSAIWRTVHRLRQDEPEHSFSLSQSAGLRHVITP